MQGEKMVEVQLARVLLHSVPAQIPQKKPEPDFGDPALARYAKTGLVIRDRDDERKMQIISVSLVADAMRRLMPSRQDEITHAEGQACSAKGVWPKAEFLALLDADLSNFALKKMADDDIIKASKDIFLQVRARQDAA